MLNVIALLVLNLLLVTKSVLYGTFCVRVCARARVCVCVCVFWPVVVDAMGKPGAGILEYGAHWYGDFLECESVPQARFCISSFSANISGTSVSNGVYLRFSLLK